MSLDVRTVTFCPSVTLQWKETGEWNVHLVIAETSIRICYIKVLDTVPGTENNSSWRQELLLFFFLTEYNYHFSDISIEWVKVHLDTVRFNLWHVIWGKFTYLWELSYKLTFSRIYINDLWIISQKKVWILWN